MRRELENLKEVRSARICYNSRMKTIRLPFRVKKPILACGADMKGAFALAKGDKAYLFDGFGDLSQVDNFTKYEKAVKAAQARLKIRPQIVVCDLHPGYFSTQFARDYMQYLPDRQAGATRSTLYEVQHHEAHIASVIIDNSIKGEIFGVAFDGTGYGSDGNIWGGEFFSGNIKRLKRTAHLDYVRMPGGEACVKEPWRMAISYLYASFGKDFIKLKTDFIKDTDKKRWTVLKSMIDKNINSPLTSSAGRLFDAVGSLVLNKRCSEFEAQLPIGLERIAETDIDGSYYSDNSFGIIKGVVRDIRRNVRAPVISAKFHNSIAGLILKAAKKSKIRRIVLSGGVFQNRYLADKVKELLGKNNFKVYTHLKSETNDSGIPLGQIAIAHARLSAFAFNKR